MNRNQNAFAPTAATGHVSDADLRLLSEDDAELGAAGATPTIIAAIGAGAAVSSAMQDGCPTTACTSAC